MKRILLAIVVLTAAILLCLSASADHSVLPKEGDLNETEALNCAVRLLCAEQGLNEDGIRGHWYYHANYYTNGWLDDAEGSMWIVYLIDPEIIGETEETDEPYWIHREHTYYLQADTGAQIFVAEEHGPEDKQAWENAVNPLDWRSPLVPTMDQMQPDEVIGAAQEMISSAVGPENLHKWKDYFLIALTDNGRFWYRITIGNSSIDTIGYLSYTAWIDADTRQVIWHSDLDRLAFRYHIRQTTGSWYDWYDEQEASYEAEWGERSTWNYLQYAEFEEHCAGRPWVPEKFFGLPEENEVGYEEVCSTAIAWQTARDDTSKAWSVRSSAFIVDVYLWNWIDELMNGGIPPKIVRRWSIVLISDDPEPTTVEVWIDPATGEIADGPVG